MFQTKADVTFKALVAYIGHVGACEGVDFVDDALECMPKDQQEVLLKARAESMKPYQVDEKPAAGRLRKALEVWHGR